LCTCTTPALPDGDAGTLGKKPNICDAFPPIWRNVAASGEMPVQLSGSIPNRSAIKEELDPKRLLNPGRFVGDI